MQAPSHRLGRASDLLAVVALTVGTERLALIQPFGLSSPAGGPRILRTLAANPPMEVLSICTGIDAPPSTEVAPELFLPLRPRLPLDSTRVGPMVAAVDILVLRRLQRRIYDRLMRAGATRVHVVPHGLDFWAALAAAGRLRLPTFVSVHDDLRYNMRGRPYRPLALSLMARAWRCATHRFVITEALGREYDARYGTRPWTVVTDGVELSKATEAPSREALRVWFMGSLHLSYGENFKALLAALPLLDGPERGGGALAQLVFRGGTPSIDAEPGRIDARPFASEAGAHEDLRDIHVAYLPLPFGPEHTDFVRFSLPTKLITYLACGRPLLVHGPADSSTATLVRQYGAGIVVDQLDPATVAKGLRIACAQAPALVMAARKLARGQFGLDHVRERFWSKVVP